MPTNRRPRKPAFYIVTGVLTLLVLALIALFAQNLIAANEYHSILARAKSIGLTIDPEKPDPDISIDQNAHSVLENELGLKSPFLPVYKCNHIEPGPLEKSIAMIDAFAPKAKRIDQISHLPAYVRSPYGRQDIFGTLDHEFMRQQVVYFCTAAHIEYRRRNLAVCKADFETALRLLGLLGQLQNPGQAVYDGSARTLFRSWIALTAAEAQSDPQTLDYLSNLNRRIKDFDLSTALSVEATFLIRTFGHRRLSLAQRFGYNGRTIHFPVDERRYLTEVLKRIVKTKELYDAYPTQRGIATRLMEALPPPPRSGAYADANLYGRSFPEFTNLTSAAARNETYKKLVNVGIQILQFKVKTGSLPDSLDQLPDSPDLVDPYTGDPLVYRQEGKGFVVYSRGYNRIDNGAPFIELSNDVYFQTANIRKPVMSGR